METIQTPRPGNRDVIYSLSEVVSGHIHEVNNKLGTIILNAEMLAANTPEPEGPVMDIVRSATVLLEMIKDLESAIPGKMGEETSIGALMVLASRLIRGILRKRRIDLVLPALADSTPPPSDLLASFATMLLAPLAFPRLSGGQKGVLKVEFGLRETARCWKLEFDRPAELDPTICEILDRMCETHGWEFDCGNGWLAIEADEGPEA